MPEILPKKLKLPSSTPVIYAALIGNALIALTKFAAALITGSAAMFSEGIHSIADTGNQILLLYGLRQSKKPASEAFPFGHGKEVYFWAFVVAILLFAVGAGVSLYQGIFHVIEPTPIENVRVNYAVLGIAALFEGAAWIFALREFSKTKGKWGFIEAVRRGKDPSMFVVLFEDSAAILGLALAFFGVFLSARTGHAVYDGVASILIGLILGGTAIWLAYETKGLLIGESANREVVQGIREICQSIPIVEIVNEILTMHMGPDFILVNISVNFNDAVAADQMEAAIAGLDLRIKKRFPEVKRVFVEAESRKPMPGGLGPDGFTSP
jgi:cation diffusion facilitator family transporter